MVGSLNNQGKALKCSRILVLGIAYKKNVDDMRESPSTHMIEVLSSKGECVEYSDPHVPVFSRIRENNLNLRSVKLTSKNIANYDCVLQATDHDVFHYNIIYELAKLIVDSCGDYRGIFANVIKA